MTQQMADVTVASDDDQVDGRRAEDNVAKIRGEGPRYVAVGYRVAEREPVLFAITQQGVGSLRRLDIQPNPHDFGRIELRERRHGLALLGAAVRAPNGHGFYKHDPARG